MKYCHKCSTTKETTEFHKNKTTNDGLQVQCKTCVKSTYINNKTHVSERQRIYYKLNKGVIAAREKEYRERNKETINARQKEYRKTNKDKCKVATKKWRATEKGKAVGAAIASKRRSLNKCLSELDWFVLLEAQHLAKLRNIMLGSEWQVDHIVPVSLGGTNEYTNIQVVPALWNKRKGNRNCDKFFDYKPRQTAVQQGEVND